MFNIVQPNGDSPGPFTLQKPAVASVWCQDASAYLRSPGTPDLHLKRAAFERRTYKKCVTCITVYAALPGRFPFLCQVSKGSEEAFLLAIRPVVLNLKGWIVIYTMYVNFIHETSFVKRCLFKRFELKNQKEPTRTCCSQGAKSASKWNRSIFTASGTGNMRLIHQFKSTLEQWIRQNSLTSPTSYHDKVPVTLFYKYPRNAQGNCTHRPTQLPRFLYFQLILPCTEQRESENRTARRISVRTASQSCHKHSWNITSKNLPFWACCLDIRITQSSAPCG